LQRALDPAAAEALPLEHVSLDEATFRLALNEDAMATEKLAEGIRAFCVDAVKLEQLMKAV
jgi:transaldolase